MKATNKYDDIIERNHPMSKKHPRMSIADRAAQFSPFAALTGHGEAIKEAERLTETRIELDENEKKLINDKLQKAYVYLQEAKSEFLQVTVMYFVPDMRKEGGIYRTSKGNLKKIDHYRRMLILEDGTSVKIQEIINLDIVFKELS